MAKEQNKVKTEIKGIMSTRHSCVSELSITQAKCDACSETKMNLNQNNRDNISMLWHYMYYKFI